MKSVRALDVEHVRFADHDNGYRLTMELSGRSDFRAFVLSNPYRMVIDLPAFSWRAKSIEKPTTMGAIDIRQGALQDNISRIVYDLGRPVTIHTAKVIAGQGAHKDQLVVDFSYADSQKFDEHKYEIYGSLQVKEDITPSLQNVLNTATQKMDTFKVSDIPIPPKMPESKKKAQLPAIATIPQGSGLRPLIVIDAGHGGIDPGAIGAENQKEKDVTLALAKDLRDALEKSGKYRVKLTREKDVFISLKDRVKFARKNEADLFVSIHADSIHKPDVHGTSLYTLSKDASDAQTAKLAERENSVDLLGGVNLNVEDEQIAFILGDFLMTETLNQSKFFANTLVSKLEIHGVQTLDNTHRFAGFAVLKSPDVPSILIEAGFMSNKKEAQLLSQKNHRSKITKAIHAGIEAYFQHVKQASN